MDEEKSLMESIFWGDISPVDMLAHRNRAVQKSFERYMQAHDRFSQKLKEINPDLDKELDELFSVHYQYIGDIHVQAFSIGCSMGMRLMKEAMNTPIGVDA